jgi:hypothetical protein
MESAIAGYVKALRAEVESLNSTIADRNAHIARLQETVERLHVKRDEAERHNIHRYNARQRLWSRKTFGNGKRTKGIIAHIRKELAEIEAKPDDLEEWIDVVILALDGYWRHGGEPIDLMWHLQAKQDKNYDRQWPAPGPEDEPVEHVREV